MIGAQHDRYQGIQLTPNTYLALVAPGLKIQILLAAAAMAVISQRTTEPSTEHLKKKLAEQTTAEPSAGHLKNTLAAVQQCSHITKTPTTTLQNRTHHLLQQRSHLPRQRTFGHHPGMRRPRQDIAIDALVSSPWMQIYKCETGWCRDKPPPPSTRFTIIGWPVNPATKRTSKSTTVLLTACNNTTIWP